jgi:hypothetical protein
MDCPRCGGVMRQEQSHDHFEFAVHAEFAGWHCNNCEEILDCVIAVNPFQSKCAQPVSAILKEKTLPWTL